jgi:uncharacterized protein (DUF2147 family)
MHALALIAALAQAAQATAPASLASIEGLWRSPGGNTIMQVAPCGDSSCGTVAWATDQAKKDSSKTTAQLVGTQLLTNLKQRKEGSWIGKLFIPDRNMRVTAKIERIGPAQLKVSGCAAGRALCKADVWTAYTEALPTDTSVPAPK